MTPKTDVPTVEYRHHVARGEHQLGVRIGGVFVAFATLSDARVAQLVENEQANVSADNGEEGVTE